MITTTDKILIEPGISPDVAWDDYKHLDQINISTLLHAEDSPSHLKAAMDGMAYKDTPALSFGRAVHTRLLEPAIFSTRHPAQPNFGDLRSSKNRETRDAWATGQPAGAEPISQKDHNHIASMYQSVMSHPVINVLRASGGCEQTVIADLAGVRCKGRLDKLTDNRPTIIDIKKVRARHGGERQFTRAIIDYEYDAKAAFYVDLVESITGEAPAFLWVVVEDNAPYAVYVYQASKVTLHAGRNRYMRWLNTYKDGINSGVWPGPCNQIMTLDTPDWRLKEEGAI